MSAKSTKEIKRRQRSIGAVQKVTRAMEMVSSVKMRKSQQAALNSRPYAKSALAILKRISQEQKTNSQEIEKIFQNNSLFKKKNSSVVLLVAIAPDRGFVGGLNSTLLTKIHQEIEDALNNNKKIAAISVGIKAKKALEKARVEIIKEYEGIGDFIEPKQTSEITEYIISAYENQNASEVRVVYTEFLSTLKQKPASRKLLPISIEGIEESISSIAPEQGRWSKENKEELDSSKPADYIFEPTPEKLLDEISPFLISITLYQIILEANASEHSSRMVAMRNASQNAQRILEELTLSYNKARQNAITSEISEVSSGAEAMST